MSSDSSQVSDEGDTPSQRQKNQRIIQDTLNLGKTVQIQRQIIGPSLASPKNGEPVETQYLQTLSQNKKSNKKNITIIEQVREGKLHIDIRVNDYFNFMRLQHETDELERISRNTKEAKEQNSTSKPHDETTEKSNSQRPSHDGTGAHRKVPIIE